VIPRADTVFRVDPPALAAAGGRDRTRGALLVALGAPLGFIGLLTTAYAILALAWHHFEDGKDVVAGVGVLVVLALPLAAGALLLVRGVRRLRRGATLLELASLVYDKTLVTVLDLAGRTGKSPDRVLAELALAADRGAAVRL